MNRRKLFNLVLIATLFALVVAACGDSATDTVTEDTTATETSTTTTTSEPVAAVESFHPEDKGWEMVWSDEFDGDQLDETKWGYEVNCWGGGNNEQQCYTDRTDNTFLSDGILHIRAQVEEFTGIDGSEDWDNADGLGTKTLPYTSGRIRTKGLGDWTYGRFEARALLPYGQGMWPAIWMLPTDNTYGGWAASGEIDIMEAVNLKTVYSPDNNAVHGTLHYGSEWPANVSSGTFLQLFDEHPADFFHVYALEWEEGEMRWYVDDVHYATQTADGWFSQVTGDDGSLTNLVGNEPFDQPFHIIMNVAVGGAWPGNPDATTVFPQEMLVDYVRVYECSASPEDGKGCATVSDTAMKVEGRQPPESLFEGAFTGEFDPAALGDEMLIFDDDQVFPWRFDSWIGSGDLDFELVETEDRGTVIQTTFNTDEAIVYFQSPVNYDLSDWADGTIKFDLRVLDNGSAASGLTTRVDCGFPCTSGDFSLGDVVPGEWVSYEVAISDLLANSDGGLDLSLINTPLVVFPSWGGQEGTVLQIDNVRWTR